MCVICERETDRQAETDVVVVVVVVFFFSSFFSFFFFFSFSYFLFYTVSLLNKQHRPQLEHIEVKTHPPTPHPFFFFRLMLSSTSLFPVCSFIPCL